jgi:hypothetical protein
VAQENGSAAPKVKSRPFPAGTSVNLAGDSHIARRNELDLRALSNACSDHEIRWRVSLNVRD